jgi:hypothetical protein
VIGGLWNGKDLPPKKNQQIVSGGKVQQRIIRSRTGHSIVLDDSEGSSSITIEDKNGNTMKFESASNALSIDVKGNLTIDAKGSVTIKAAGQVSIKGALINLN